MAQITITINDKDFGLSEDEIFDKADDFCKYDLDAADYEIDIN